MEWNPKYMLVISFDGLSSLDFDYISKLPNFKEFLKGSAYCRKVYSVYPSLTYPAHATIVTGKFPKNHGVVNNTLFQPNRKSPDWFWQRKYIKGNTIYDAVIKQGKKVAALLWPVTGKSKIHYNLPEIFANRPWKNQIAVSLMNGSPLYQIDLNNKFKHLRKGLKQPYLDNFVHASLLYTLEKKRPDLTLVHYVDLDSMRHYHGFNSKEAMEALERHDKRLGDIVESLKKNNMYEESAIIILGDHSSLDEDKIIRINALLREKGYIDVDINGRITDYRAISKNCDGSAYIYVKDDKCDAEKIYDLINDFNNRYKCIETVYTKTETIRLGADPNCSFMLEANKGYYFVDDIQGKLTEEVNPEEVGRLSHRTKATHGYSPYKEDYTTIFMAKGIGIRGEAVVESMNLVDEAPTIAKLLGVELKDADGKVIEEFLKLS